MSNPRSNPNGTNFTMEMPLTQGKPHSTFKKNTINHYQDKSNETSFVFFRALDGNIKFRVNLITNLRVMNDFHGLAILRVLAAI